MMPEKREKFLGLSSLHRGQPVGWFDLTQCLRKKKLSDDLFEPNRNLDPHDLSAPIQQHVSWLFKKIYSSAYPNQTSSDSEGIARECHGIQHVTRCALLVPVWANLYRKHRDPEALELTDEDLKLMQIGALFHDAARENEGEDLWDHESGVFLYLYLVKILKIDSARARLLAEAVANKDWEPGQNYIEIYEKENQLFCLRNFPRKTQRNIYQKIIHDSDCIDIIRARSVFDAKYLDFYQQTAIISEPALDDMAEIIVEGRSLIFRHGDAYGLLDLNLKKEFEHENCWDESITLIEENPYPLFKKMGIDLLPYHFFFEDKEEKMDELSGWIHDVNHGKIFARGVLHPIYHNPKHDETNTELELRKMWREEGVNSGSKKENRYHKDGNPARSVAMLGYGAGVPASAGFLIRKPDLNAFYEVSAQDLDTGRGKKKVSELMGLLGKEDAEKRLDALLKIQKMGGKPRMVPQISGDVSVWRHTEQVIKIKTVDAVYFSQDDHFLGRHVDHEYHPMLTAFYIYKCYQKKHDIEFEKRKFFYQEKYKNEDPYKRYVEQHGIREIPLIELSAVHNEMRILSQEEFSNEKIRDMWLILCQDFFEEVEWQPEEFLSLLFKKDASPRYWKNRILFGNDDRLGDQCSADEALPEDMQDEISELIFSRKEEIKYKFIENKKNEIRSSGKEKSYTGLEESVVSVKERDQPSALLLYMFQKMLLAGPEAYFFFFKESFSNCDSLSALLTMLKFFIKNSPEKKLKPEQILIVNQKINEFFEKMTEDVGGYKERIRFLLSMVFLGFDLEIEQSNQRRLMSLHRQHCGNTEFVEREKRQAEALIQTFCFLTQEEKKEGSTNNSPEKKSFKG